MDVITPTSHRQQQLVAHYLHELDVHVTDLKNGVVDEALEISDFAARLHIHATHLSNTIKVATGKTACYFYEIRLVQAAKELLLRPDMSIGQVAMQLTYDPSNFTKFFKAYTGITPKQFRQQQA